MPAAFKATFSNLKLISTRQVVQLVFELPLADFDHAYEVLGGLPDPAKERWFGIAAIRGEVVGERGQDTAARPGDTICDQPPAKRGWNDLSPSQQAGIRCDEPSFAAFLKEERQDDWHEAQSDPAECVRLICGVQSRSDLATNHSARAMWVALNDQYEAWKQVEHA